MAPSLRSAKLTLMKDNSVASRPRLWASFVLLADAGS